MSVINKKYKFNIQIVAASSSQSEDILIREHTHIIIFYPYIVLYNSMDLDSMMNCFLQD